MHVERHGIEKIGWLRAAVLGANDGILSVGSLVVGIASASPNSQAILLTGIAGLTAGAVSMAAGEYVSVSSQADTEAADQKREERELRENPVGELQELTDIYIQRGLDESLARQVAETLMQHDALGTHLRDELGMTQVHTARPLQAAVASAAAFAVGAGLPVLVAFLSSPQVVVVTVGFTTIVSLGCLGAISARIGGASMIRAAARVAFWGVIAMVATSLVGLLFGTTMI